VTGFDGDVDEMTTPLDDRALEALLSGASSAQSGFDWLLPFVEDLEKASRQPAPVIQPALARLLSEGFSTEMGNLLAAGPPPRRTCRLTAKVAGLSMALMAAGTTAAAAAGVLPDPAQHVVATVVEATTPFSFPDTASVKATIVSTTNADASRPTVLSVGRTGAGGLATTSTTAGGNGAAGGPGVTGLDRADQTPAAGKVPTSVPANAGRPASPGSNGLGTAATTPAAGKAPASVPADTRPDPAAAGRRGGHGSDTVSSTPAATRPSTRP
jgi:hypothetical protein